MDSVLEYKTKTILCTGNPSAGGYQSNKLSRGYNRIGADDGIVLSSRSSLVIRFVTAAHSTTTRQ